MHNKFLEKHQSIIIGLSIFIAMILAVSIFSFVAIDNQHHFVYVENLWLSRHKLIITLWHILLITAIYWGWGLKINLAAQRMNINAARTRKLKRVRWFLIAGLLLIDLFIYL